MKTRAKSGVAEELLSGHVDGLQPLLMSLSPRHPFFLARFGAPNPPAVQQKLTSSWPGVCDRASLPTHLLKPQPSAFTKTPLFHRKPFSTCVHAAFCPMPQPPHPNGAGGHHEAVLVVTPNLHSLAPFWSRAGSAGRRGTLRAARCALWDNGGL